MPEDRIAAALIELVRDVAATEIMPRFRNLDPRDIDTKSGPDDLVTVADRRAEDALARGVARMLPGAAIVGEEACASDPGILEAIDVAGSCVIVDPIDGTANFATGIAVFGVILALVEDGRTTLGLLYDPILDDWVLARTGGGAWYGRPGTPPRRVTSRTVRPLAEAHGLMPLHQFKEADRSAIAARMATIGVARTLRCSCHEYRLLAMGHADFYLSPDLKPWDHAAGALVLQEAGGATLVHGTAYRPSLRQGPILAAADPEGLGAVARHFDMLDFTGGTSHPVTARS